MVYCYRRQQYRRLNSATQEFQESDVPTPLSRLHGLVADESGNIRFTEKGASSHSSGISAVWFDIHDNVWFSMASAHKVGRFDQSTGTMDEYDTPIPNTTSRFIHADTEGRVWFQNDVNDK